ncbi:MAG TPA: hypothetical protein DCY45_00120, partial [Mesotoga sp.]|nr:hypothetical protein [Mesotoga sp.]
HGWLRQEGEKIAELADSGLGIGQSKRTGSPLAEETCYSFRTDDLFFVPRSAARLKTVTPLYAV